MVTLHTAFLARKACPKTYVQHLMANNASEILRILDGEGRLYVCGDGSKMAPDVEHELKKAYLVIHGVKNKKRINGWRICRHPGGMRKMSGRVYRFVGLGFPLCRRSQIMASPAWESGYDRFPARSGSNLC